MSTIYGAYTLLQNTLDTLEKQASALNIEAAKLPKGYLIVNRQPKSTAFYESDGETRKGITRKMNLVRKLARKGYLELMTAEYQIAIEGLGKIIKRLNPAKLQGYVGRFADTPVSRDSIVWSQRQRDISFAQSENPYGRDKLIYKSNNGVRVRSKSELVWANLYEEMGIPYAYERKITLDVTDMPDVKGAWEQGGRWYKDYYPDFTLFLADGTVVIHEHLGRIDLGEYRGKAGERIIAMTKNGLIPAKLLLTYESDVRDTAKFVRILLQHVIPCV